MDSIDWIAWLGAQEPSLAQRRLAAALSAGLGVGGWIGRRRLPAGVGPGALVTGVSLALLLLPGAMGRAWSQASLIRALVGLSAVWFSLGLLRASLATRTGALPGVDPARLVFLLAALVCAAVAVAGMLRDGAAAELDGSTGLPPAAWNFAALIVVAFVAAWRVGHGGAYVAVALILAGAVLGARNAARTELAGPVVKLATSGAALAVAIAASLAGWWRRRSVWLTNPEALLAPAGRGWTTVLVVLALSAASIVAAAVGHGGFGPPVAAVLAGLACLTAGHLCSALWLAEFGLFAVAASIPLAGRPFGAAGMFIGLAIAGAWGLWLARFWAQQLLDGQPWTTAGRLIPAARRLAVAAAVAMLAHSLVTYPLENGAAWLRHALAGLLAWAFARSLTRDAADPSRAYLAYAAILALVSAVAPIHAVLSASIGWTPVAATVLAALGLLAAALIRRRSADRVFSSAYNLLLGAVVPILMVNVYALTGINAETAIAGLLAIAAVGVGIGRWPRPRGADSAASASSQPSGTPSSRAYDSARSDT